MCRHEALMFALMFAHYVLSENTIIVVDSPIEGERVALRGVLFLVRIANGMAHDFEVALYSCRVPVPTATCVVRSGLPACCRRTSMRASPQNSRVG
jgi:hypothetical protein